MTAVKQILIKGFQSHIESDIGLSNGLNVITGPSDSGKTAVLRAVRWVAFNEPAGEAFLNRVVGETEVSLTLDTGQVITKRRRRGKTSYLFQQNEDDEGSLFEKSEVPEEVTAALGIRKETFGDFETTLNFAYQLDAPFLISETASAGAKVLGKLAGTAAVDMAVKSVNKDTIAARNERSRATQDIEKINGELLKYAGVEEAKEQLELAQYVLDEAERKIERLSELKGFLETYAYQLEVFRSVTEKLDKLQIVSVLTEQLEQIEKAQYKRVGLLDLNCQLQKAAATAKETDTVLSNLTGIPAATEILTGVVTSHEKGHLLNSLYKEYTKYTLLVNNSAEKLQRIGDLHSLNSLLHSVEESLYTRKTLSNTAEDYRASNNKLRASQERLEMFRDLWRGHALLRVLEANNASLSNLKSLVSSYDKCRSFISMSEDVMKEAEEHVSKAQAEINQAFKEAGGICPLCESPVVCSH
ncbi:AAA family ATPase [Bacillus sp. L381]|uniref:AAA family ATPase n=1 Tax=Bacillus TaxID=1386 RepID=UPI001BAC0D64|nr:MULTISPECIES: AAA family ATPase [Bacillus]MCR9040896.1 AAA family ATPase [Bacillus velezensis]QUN08017.1 AAA family ATPase [Bacillus amyloliquefaciens]QYM81083.1 AAA family ATPase [Bacillus sp. 7D3]QZY10232.1 AAA family ATPase [Bacillus amyloliquefaciens]QZY11142.1 AAA family ATPase [Bacillus amyloliquefaciens]